MLAPISWLKDFVDIKVSAKELSEKLLKSGFEVEEIIELGKDISNVITGKVLSVEKHENADKLKVLKVDVGNNKILNIVTGADNVSVGCISAVAVDGATIANGVKIKTGKLRGIVSEGMLCAYSELGINSEKETGHGVILFDKNTKLGVDVKEVLGLNDTILDISITANRPDCQSIYGIAREVAAVLNEKFIEPDFSFEEDKNETIKRYLKTKVEDNSLCRRYINKVVCDVKIEPSPKWMQDRLKLVNLKPINNIVDITNYVLMEMGQPMHAFDAASLEKSEIVVRRAKDGEKITALNDKEVVLSSDNLVICDANKPVAIAGVIGGLNTGIMNNTVSVIFESAKFARDNIRRTSKKIGIRTDASSRYEKGVDAWTVEKALRRALNLVTKLNAGRIISGEIDINAEQKANKTIVCKKQKIDDLLGVSIPDDEALKILNNLNIKSEIKNGELISTIPEYRDDLEGYADLAEELIRSYGYDHITSTMLKDASVTNGGLSEQQTLKELLKNMLVENGFNEVITYSFISPKYFKTLEIEEVPTVKLLNPLGEELSVMRMTLIHSLIETAVRNVKLKNLDGRIFECARVYIPTKNELITLPEENTNIALATFGENEDFYKLKGIVENIFETYGVEFDIQVSNRSFLHSGRSADIMVGKDCVGYFGELNPKTARKYDMIGRIFVAEISLDYLERIRNTEKHFSPIPKYPNMVRDLCFTLKNDLTMKSIVEQIKKSASSLLESVKMFDFYNGKQIKEGYMSMSFTLSFRAGDRTLTDEEVDKEIDKIVKDIKRVFDGELR